MADNTLTEEFGEIFISYDECTFILNELRKIIEESNPRSDEFIEQINEVSLFLIKMIDSKMDYFEGDDLTQIQIAFTVRELEIIFDGIEILNKLSKDRNDAQSTHTASSNLISFVESIMVWM